MSDSHFIITVKNKDGTINTLDEPYTPDRISSIINDILSNQTIRIVKFVRVGNKYKDKKVLEWFIEKLSDEDNFTYRDAIFRQKNETIWPFELIDENKIPKEIEGDDYENIAKWLWSEGTAEQKEHIKEIYKIFS